MSDADTPTGADLEPGASEPVETDAGDRGEEKAESSDAGVGGAVYREDESASPGHGDTQDEPAMAQNATNASEQFAGLVAQTRADVGVGNADEFERVLRQRLDQAGIRVEDATILEVSRTGEFSA